MNLEQLGGFFAALIVGPKTAMPRQYYPEVFGRNIGAWWCAMTVRSKSTARSLISPAS